MTPVRQSLVRTSPPEAEDLLKAGGALPIVMVMIEQGHIVDVRVPQGGCALATRDFITAHLAAGSCIPNGGNSCNVSAGRSPSSSD
jgi:hypothetical protein